jgi:hypothetical protein
MIFFEEGSPDKNIHAALREAARVRKVLREEEADKIASRAAVPPKQTGDGDEQPPAISRRHMDRRTFSTGRSRP